MRIKLIRGTKKWIKLIIDRGTRIKRMKDRAVLCGLALRKTDDTDTVQRPPRRFAIRNDTDPHRIQERHSLKGKLGT